MAIQDFDPNAPSANPNNLFGLPHSAEEARLVVIPVPWEVTVSGKPGTANGPKQVLLASHQVDLFDAEHPELWKAGIAFDAFPTPLITLQAEAMKCINNYRKLSTVSNLQKDSPQAIVLRKAVNECCEQVNYWVKRRAENWIEQDKLVATLGGDHSTCYGLVHALSEKHGDLSILQIDAHADLRNAYEGLTYSHASIMYNLMQLEGVNSLTGVGIRDISEEEHKTIESNDGITCHYDQQIRTNIYAGTGWASIVDTIVEGLGQTVYLSFDVDGLQPALCPNTGTPVPGGLEFEEALFLIAAIKKSGRTIVGFDISECGDGELDGNVAARLLWRIFGVVG
ncbi:MAG: agmatinase family protein [Flavobacteriales bacterium]|nr:agmatinase family protein [Flavobacteriales bacterium]